MKPSTTSIEGVILLQPTVFSDDRGWFMELFKQSTFGEAGLPVRFVQDNFSFSHRGVIRGLHFQIDPFAQGKLITCVHGAIFDVVVDLRPHSPTFGKWESAELSAENRMALYAPEGLAHGFQALGKTNRVLYKCTTEYSKEHEEGILYSDSDLQIPWPLPSPTLSRKDLDLPTLAEWKVARGLA
jgi:dTDP-4-dehydrorhamnose 3,5-epimerase